MLHIKFIIIIMLFTPGLDFSESGSSLHSTSLDPVSIFPLTLDSVKTS